MGRVKVIGDRNGRVWPLVLRDAAESRKAGRRLILYVPEQYTLQAERDIITGLKLPGLLDIQVISPRKLKQQVREQSGTATRQPLNEMGRAMAVHRVMTEQEENLSYYRNMTELSGAVARVSGALDELMESDIEPGELEEYAGGMVTGAERAKLSDLKTLWDGYTALVSEQFDDEKAIWTDAVTRLEKSGLWQDADLAVYGFDAIRPDLRELIVRICRQVNSVSVYLVMDEKKAPDGRIFIQQHESLDQLATALEEARTVAEEIFPHSERTGCAPALAFLDRNLFALNPEVWTGETDGALKLYAGSSPWDEAETVAATLREWHEEGIPWNRMAIALPPGAGSEGILRANLKIRGIPFVWQQKDKAVNHPVCRMLLSALSILSEGYRTDKVITVARSGFCTLTEDEGLHLEDYARAHGVEGRRWQRPFTSGENAEETDELRLRLIRPIEELRIRLKEAGNAAASAEAIADFLETENVWNRLQEEEEMLLQHEMYREAIINRQIWKLLMELLEQLGTLLGPRRAAIRDLKYMLESALNPVELAALPEEEGGVIVGETGHLLAGEIRALILPQAQDGMLTAPESGWLTDAERRKLEEATGKAIGVSRETGCLIRKYDFYRTLTLPKEKLMISWSLRSEDGGALQPDGLIAQIRELYPDLHGEGGMLGQADRREPETPRAALEGAGPWLTEIRKGLIDDVPRNWKTALIQLLHNGTYGETVHRILEEMLPTDEIRKLEKETARRLFMTDRLSISRLEQFASCPYRHFIDYGLRPVKQENFTYESADAGTFFHEALDRYMKQAGAERDWPGFTAERVDSMMDTILAELTEEWKDTPLREDAMGEWTGEGYVRRVRHAAHVLTRFAANSEFRTIATEQPFGEGEGLPPVVIPLADGSHAAIRGQIDRIDTYENGEGVWLRVVDNKSRGKKPDPAKMETGEQLQLMIYLKAAADSMPGTRVAGAMFFPIEDKEVDTASDEPDKIENDRISEVRMKGLVTAEEDLIRAMDRDVHPFSVDKVFKQDGTVAKSASWAVEEKTLSGLMDAAVEKAGELCGRMRDGEIEALPSEDSAGPVCRFCEYSAICRNGGRETRKPDDGITYQDIAGKTRCAKPKSSV